MTIFRQVFRRLVLPLTAFVLSSLVAHAQTQGETKDPEVEQLRQTVEALEARVAALEHELNVQHSTGNEAGAQQAAAALASATAELKPADPAPSTSPLATGHAADPVTQQAPSAPASATSLPLPANLPGGATLNYLLDAYYDNNFNRPIGRVNYLRAYDVLSNTFNLSQADVVFELPPDLAAQRRYGVRVDLQFGQATASLQGSPNNELRPDIYRNIFQAYGTYVVPVGRGLKVDFGKWASSLGLEGNYAKDQINYSRSFFFDYLPYYHMGVRATYPITSTIAANYWIVNGTQQTEPTNSFKDQLFGLTLKPASTVLWNVNYYLGQEHPDITPATNCTVPLQPGLCFTPVTPAPNGKLDIFDSYATWNATSKITAALEGDYVIQRLWENAAPGESSAPSHVDGTAAYLQYQWTPRMAFGFRGEYLADPQGLFSSRSQYLKEGTATLKYTVADGLDAFLEYRRDWSNEKYFLTNKPGALTSDQPTATVGLVWWYGGKQGSW